MNTRTSSKWLTSVVGAGALFAAVSFGGVAGASAASTSGGPGAEAPTRTVDNVRARCDSEIARRLDKLGELQGRVDNTAAATAAHKAALTSDLSSEESGLTSLKSQIDEAGDLRALHDLCPRIVFDFRVYVLEVPKVHLGLAGDRLARVDTKLSELVPKLDGAISKAKASGRDTSAAETAVADMKTKLGSVSDPSAIGDAVIPLTPAQYNDGSAMSVLTNSRDTVVADHQALAQAAQDARTAVKALKALRGSEGSSATTTTTA